MTSDLNNFNSKSTDDALVLLAQQGNIKAETLILQRYRAVVSEIASGFSGVSLERDDIIQEGMLGLISAVYSFSAEKKASFRTYSAVCISNSIRTALKAETTLKNSPLNTYVPIENENIVSEISPESIFIAQENNLRIKSIINRNLSVLEKNVLYLYISGKSYKEIGTGLDITEKSVDNALQRVRTKLSRLLKDEES